MSSKLLWTGLALIIAPAIVTFIPEREIVGSLLMVIGVVLHWLDK